MKKKQLKRLPILGSILIFLNRRIFSKQTAQYDPPSIWLNKFLQGEKVRIIQIGSNDGLHGDPIYNLIKQNPTWRALFVEPIPYLFERLRKNYGMDGRFSFVNAAINEGKQQVFYSVKEEAKVDLPFLPSWYDQLGSFKKENILKHLDGVLEPYIVETELLGMSLSELFQKNEVQDITLLHIDAEGYDWKILSQLNLARYKPEIILFEHKHLSTSELNSSIDFLKEIYFIFSLKSDYICLLESKINIDSLKELRGVLISSPKT